MSKWAHSIFFPHHFPPAFLTKTSSITPSFKNTFQPQGMLDWLSGVCKDVCACVCVCVCVCGLFSGPVKVYSLTWSEGIHPSVCLFFPVHRILLFLIYWHVNSAKISSPCCAKDTIIRVLLMGSVCGIVRFMFIILEKLKKRLFLNSCHYYWHKPVTKWKLLFLYECLRVTIVDKDK